MVPISNFFKKAPFKKNQYRCTLMGKYELSPGLSSHPLLPDNSFCTPHTPSFTPPHIYQIVNPFHPAIFCFSSTLPWKLTRHYPLDWSPFFTTPLLSFTVTVKVLTLIFSSSNFIPHLILYYGTLRGQYHIIPQKSTFPY